jgi:uncharacterized membrane protein YtjA (UPF0391 family)
MLIWFLVLLAGLIILAVLAFTKIAKEFAPKARILFYVFLLAIAIVGIFSVVTNY